MMSLALEDGLPVEKRVYEAYQPWLNAVYLG
jgi:hypothetical protein